MFGFGKKKTPEPAAGGRPARARNSGGSGARGSRGDNDLSMFGVPGMDDPMNDAGDDDDDLEGELLSLLGGTGGSPRKPKRPSAPPQPQRGSASKQPNPAVLRDDFSDGDDVSDDDIDEGELEAELGELVGDPVPEAKPNIAAAAPAPVAPSMSSGSILSTLQDRLQLYEKAKSRADASGETAKSRRFTRAIKTLKDLIKNASAGKVVDEADIPPVVALGDDKNKNPPPQAAPEPAPAEAELPEEKPEPPPRRPAPVPVYMPSFEPITQVPCLKPEPAMPAEAPEVPEKLMGPPGIIVPTPDPEAEARLKEYKKFAVLYKKGGDVENAKHYFMLSKSLEAAMKSGSGSPVDLSAFPAPEIPVQKEAEVPPQPASENPNPPGSEAPPPAEEAAGITGIPPEIFAAPDAPKTIMEALDQRLEKYKSEVEKAKSDNNSSKARRMGRIVKQYEEAIALYKKGKPVPFDDLPAPPGFAPIPLPATAGAAVAAPGGGVSAPSLVPAPAPARAPSPAIPTSNSEDPPPEPTDAATPSVISPQKPTKPAAPQVSPGVLKPHLGKSTLQERQLNAILKRQQQYKDAALEAKKKGDLDQARELLRTAKGFDKLIGASQAGLPVDMNTLPSEPEAVAALDAEGGFELVSGDDCLEPPTDASLAEIFAKLEEDLKTQLKTCMRNREHFKSIGDVGSANRFERMALESKRDLDTLRLAARSGSHIPKYHYETRVFSITECNTDLTEDEIEVMVLQGVNYKVSNPADVDTYIKVEFPYPSAEEAQTFKTSVIKDTNNPVYNATFKMMVTRSGRNFQRFIHRHGVKLEVWSKGGFLRSSTLIGTATAKLLGLETKCTIHDAFDVLDGRKPVGKLEVKIRLRDPVLVKQITQKKEKWLSIDRV